MKHNWKYLVTRARRLRRVHERHRQPYSGGQLLVYRQLNDNMGIAGLMIHYQCNKCQEKAWLDIYEHKLIQRYLYSHINYIELAIKSYNEIECNISCKESIFKNLLS